MPVSPGKVFKAFSNKVWSGRARRIAKIIDADNAKVTQQAGQPTKPKTTKGATN